MHRSILAILLALAMTILPAANAAVPREDSERYTLTVGLVSFAPFDCEGDATNFGGACFLLDGSERFLKIVVTDDTGAPVAGSFSFFDGSSNRLKSVNFCGSSITTSVPAGSAQVVVYLGQNANAACLPGVGTSGTVTAQWS